ncbi:MAG TPA: PhzF family phenazine biosynthesis protein [Polyangiaceae bacterium]|nr:PhzF family phenazine biosynthesis protein [Polyangiaceae bacterium]
MTVPIVQVDAFTSTPFRGNPAAVCVLPAPAEETWMQSVAAEMNLSETAFLHREDGAFRLRWFTPTVEVDLCGHATLASAHVLWEEGHLPRGERARFLSKSGTLTAEARDGLIELDFPASPTVPAAAPGPLAQALGVALTFVGTTPFDYLVEVASEDVVRGLRPDMTALARIDTRGIIVTARASTPHYDFVSRFFGPRAGVPEDPVTGSAHCALGPYWRSRLGKDAFLAHQASLRGGDVRVKVAGDRVKLGGHAVTILRGELV